MVEKVQYARSVFDSNGKELSIVLQITRVDANQEVIAHTRRLVDAYDHAENRRQERLKKEREKQRSSERRLAGTDGDKEQDTRAELSTDSSYVFRSPVGSRITSDDIQDHWGQTRPAFRRFDAKLRRFFTSYWPQIPIGDLPIKVSCILYRIFSYVNPQPLDQRLFTSGSYLSVTRGLSSSEGHSPMQLRLSLAPTP
jgi:hypothetical protein